MLSELAADELSDVPRTDDDDALDERRVPPNHSTRERARPGDERDREQPEDSQLLLVWIGQTSDPREREEQPHADGHEVENTDELVHGRVVGQLLVEVVEAVELRADDPGRKRQDEHEQLEAERERAGLAVTPGEE